MTEVDNRLQALEAIQAQAEMAAQLTIENRITTLEQQQKHANDLLEQLRIGQQEMSTQLTRYHGLVGGIMLTITAVGALITLAKDYILEHWTR